MSACLRCGSCCFTNLAKDGKLYPSRKKKCKFMVKLPSGSTVCRVYNKRLGTVLSEDKFHKTFCGVREGSTFDYEGCPFNTDKKVAGVDIPFIEDLENEVEK